MHFQVCFTIAAPRPAAPLVLEDVVRELLEVLRGFFGLLEVLRGFVQEHISVGAKLVPQLALLGHHAPLLRGLEVGSFFLKPHKVFLHQLPLVCAALVLASVSPLHHLV